MVGSSGEFIPHNFILRILPPAYYVPSWVLDWDPVFDWVTRVSRPCTVGRANWYDHWPLHSEIKVDASPRHFRKRRANLEAGNECGSWPEVGQSKTHFWLPLISKME